MKSFYKMYSKASNVVKLICTITVGLCVLWAARVIYVYFDEIVRGIMTAVIIVVVGYLVLLALKDFMNKLDKK